MLIPADLMYLFSKNQMCFNNSEHILKTIYGVVTPRILVFCTFKFLNFLSEYEVRDSAWLI